MIKYTDGSFVGFISSSGNDNILSYEIDKDGSMTIQSTGQEAPDLPALSSFIFSSDFPTISELHLSNNITKLPNSFTSNLPAGVVIDGTHGDVHRAALGGGRLAG